MHCRRKFMNFQPLALFNHITTSNLSKAPPIFQISRHQRHDTTKRRRAWWVKQLEFVVQSKDDPRENSHQKYSPFLSLICIARRSLFVDKALVGHRRLWKVSWRKGNISSLPRFIRWRIDTYPEPSMEGVFVHMQSQDSKCSSSKLKIDGIVVLQSVHPGHSLQNECRGIYF